MAQFDLSDLISKLAAVGAPTSYGCSEDIGPAERMVPNNIACSYDSDLDFLKFGRMAPNRGAGGTSRSFALGVRTLLIQNRVLAGLPRKDYRSLLLVLEPVKLAFGQVLYESQARIRHVYFPNDCFVSMLTGVNGNRSAEVGLIGSEGMIGLPVALGIGVSPFRAVVQGGGTAMRMKISDFRREFSRSAALKRELFLFTHLLMIQIAQTAACNRFHRVAQRMARWMLMTSDRIKSNDFRITQEFLALMLGVRRVGVSAAASRLRERKLMDYRRGSFTILDHRGLVAAACDCYQIVKDVYARAQGGRDLSHQRRRNHARNHTGR